jgi:hypothetical protein
MSFRLDSGATESKSISFNDVGQDTSVLLWSSPNNLGDTSHTLEIIHDTDFSSRSGTDVVFYLDRVMYTTTPTTPRQNLLYFRDDNDPRIQYAGNWIRTKSPFCLGGAGMTGNATGNSFQLGFTGQCALRYLVMN